MCLVAPIPSCPPCRHGRSITQPCLRAPCTTPSLFVKSCNKCRAFNFARSSFPVQPLSPSCVSLLLDTHTRLSYVYGLSQCQRPRTHCRGSPPSERCKHCLATDWLWSLLMVPSFRHAALATVLAKHSSEGRSPIYPRRSGSTGPADSIISIPPCRSGCTYCVGPTRYLLYATPFPFPPASPVPVLITCRPRSIVHTDVHNVPSGRSRQLSNPRICRVPQASWMSRWTTE